MPRCASCCRRCPTVSRPRRTGATQARRSARRWGFERASAGRNLVALSDLADAYAHLVSALLKDRRTIIDASFDQIREFIQENLPIGPAPTVPELRLHRAGPRSGLWRLAEGDGSLGSPYWAFDWGGGLAL